MQTISSRFSHWFIALSLLVAGLWLLRGKEVEQTSNDGRTEVVLWHFWGGSDLEVVRDVVARFNAAQQEYRVREIAMPGNNLRAKLFLSAAGGTPPDLINIDDPVIADWYELGLLQSVSEIVGAEEAARISSELLPAARQLSSYRGSLIGICNGLDVRALFYNQTFLQQHGWSVPQTLEQLDELGRKVRELGIDQPQFAFLPTPRRALFFTNVFGGSVWDFKTECPHLDSPAAVAALDWLQSYSRDYGADLVAAYRQSDQSLPGKSFPLLPQSDGAQVGRYVFSLDGQWRVRDLRTFQAVRAARGLSQPEFGVAPFPAFVAAGKIPPKDSHGWVNGNVFVFPKRGQASSGAVAFAKFWCGLAEPDAAAETCLKGGWLPVSPRVIASSKFQAALNDDRLYRQFVQLAGSPALQPTPVVRGAGYLVRLLESTAERVSSDVRLSSQGELEEANRQMQQYLRSLTSNSPEASQ